MFQKIEEKGSEAEGSEDTRERERERERVQLKGGGKIDSGRESRWERKQYIPLLRLGEKDERKGVKRDVCRQNGEEMRHLSCVSRIDKTGTQGVCCIQQGL